MPRPEIMSRTMVTGHYQPVMEVWRRTETGVAPRRQGATRLRQGFGAVSPKLWVQDERRRTTENIGNI
jgi:hypothetical protein